VNLGGRWPATQATDELRRVFAEPGFDDSAWDALTVPGHWRTEAAFADNDSALVARHRFTALAPAEGRRSWLMFDGVFYQSDVWLDGAYVGDTEGYFTPHEFEITETLRTRADHVLAVEVTCAPQRSRTSKRNLTGVFQHWDCIDPQWNPGGIWQPVHIEESGPVRIQRLRAVCVSASTERAEVAFRAIVDAAVAGTVVMRAQVGETQYEHTQTLAVGHNRVEWNVVIERPMLWWPWSLGAPDLNDAVVEALVGDEVSDERRFRIGLRQVRMRNWIWEINGERLHLKGANLGPTRMAIGDATLAELRRDLEAAREAGLDLVRLHGHITHPAMYEAADELGMLLWQDLPLQWGYARTVRKQATQQARDAIDVLGHHASIITWCTHNEPLALDIEPDALGGPKKAAEMITKYLTLQMLPTWNKTILDTALARAMTKADRSRPVNAHSGILPGPFSGGTDSHLYFGWYHGAERDLTRAAGIVPRVMRFVSEFGAQAVPVDAAFCDPQLWPDLDWDELGRKRSMQKTFFDRHVPPAAYASFAAWQLATQDYQAEVLRRHIEEFRRIKYRPNGGFCLFSLADALDHPAITWAILGHDRAPKRAYEAVTDACRPVIVTCDRPPAAVAVGDAFRLDVHVVSDVRHVLRGATVRARIHWPGGEHVWMWQGDVGADTVTRIGAIDLVAPSPAHPAARAHARSGEDPVRELVVDLTFEHPDHTATNRYLSRFV
jgi:beta-mannosidase